MHLQISVHPEINARPSLVGVFRPHVSNAAFAEENTNEGRIIDLRPIPDWEGQGIGVVVRRVTELDIAVHRYLGKKKIK